MPPRRRLGELPPRYRFALNPSTETRVSRCPRCQGLTHERKFALLIFVEPAELQVMGKTCKYCTPCEYIICHQAELEGELVLQYERTRPEVIGNPYVVVGTVELAAWRVGLTEPRSFNQVLQHTAEFKHYHTLEYDPGGWSLAEDLPAHPPVARRPRRLR